MSPDPDQNPADLNNREYFSESWCSLPWSPWVPFTAVKHEFRQIPKEPGLYRIRPIGKDFLMYLGETGRTLRKRFGELRRHSLAEEFPWNDPHTAAQSLWVWNKAEGYSYECSAAPLKVLENERIGWESFLLAKYRQEFGESTLCNFGRFHKRYWKSTGRKLKNGKPGTKGGKLETDQMDKSAGGPSHSPLHAIGTPGDPNWMGLSWSGHETLVPEKTRTVSAGPGLYVLIDTVSLEIIYIDF